MRMSATSVSRHALSDRLRLPGVEGGNAKGGGKPGKKTEAESVIEKHLEKAKRAREQEDKWLGVQNNLAVYVTGLPDDTTEAELAQVTSFP